MKDDRVYLGHILRCIARIEEYTVEGRDKFFASPLALHPDVDWKGLAGFRNVLVHDYLGVDLELVYRAVEHDVPRLKRACESATKEVEDQKP